MNNKDIILQRLINQRIVQSDFTTPEQVVSYMGAMQAQDWSMAKWAIGLRLPGSCDADIEKAFNEGSILRTHVLRPTWHVVTPMDIGWITKLSAPRVHALNGLYYRKFGLDDKTLKKTRDILRKELADNNFKTREELNEKFVKSKISGDRVKLAYIMMHAELEGLICSGPRIGKQFTYAMLAERAPKAIALSNTDALQRLATIYFTSRGPASMADFAWWSGLKMVDCKTAVESLDNSFERMVIDDTEYIMKENPNPESKRSATFLMPDYDEYGIGYKDRSMYHHPRWAAKEKVAAQEFFHAMVVDGYFGGMWAKVTKGNKPAVNVKPLPSIPVKYKGAIARAEKDYNRFFGVK